MIVTSAAERGALLDLSYGYAAGIDRRDRERFLAVFHPDAVLRSYDPAEAEVAMMERKGHAKLGAIVDRIVPAMCTRSFHLVANARFAVNDMRATGEIYGVAHHLVERVEQPPSDVVMFMRYRDRYTRLEGEWRIAERDALVDWTETRLVEPA